MAATTYITSAEATILYDDSLYASGEKSQALTLSFGLVNSYLNAALNVPAVTEWNGSDTSLTAPAVLKLAQGKFYEYLLRRGEVGDTPDVVSVYESARSFAREITQEELTIPESTTYEREVGWHIVSKSNAGGGDCFIRGTAPTYSEHLKLTITNAATASYAGTFTYTLTWPSRSSTSSTGNATSFDWLTIAALPDGSRPFELRWTGKWTNGDYVEIRGVAAEQVDAQPPQRNTLQQSVVNY